MRLRPVNYILFLTAVVILVLLSVLNWNKSNTDSNPLEQKAAIQRQFHDQESLIIKTLSSNEKIVPLLEWASTGIKNTEKDDKQLLTLDNLPFSIAIINQGQIKAWNHEENYYSPDWEKSQWILSNDSIFSRLYPFKYQGKELLIMCQFSIPGTFRQSDSTPGALWIKDSAGNKVASITAVSKHKVHTKSWPLLLYCLAYSLIFISLSIALNQNKKNGLIWQYLILLLIPIIFRGIDYWLAIGQNIDSHLIRGSADSVHFLSGTFGNLVIIISIYFSFVTHLIQHPRWFSLYKNASYRNIKIGSLYYFLNFFILSLLLLFCRELVINSGVDFDFSTFLTLGIVPLLGIIIFSILIIRFFFFSYQINSILSKFRLSLKEKAICMMLTCAVLIPMLILTQLHLSIYIVILVLLLYALIFDIFIEIKSPTLGWLVIWIIFFSAFATITLFKFNRDKENEEKRHVINLLRRPVDSIALGNMNKLVYFLKTNKQFYPMMDAAIRDLDMHKVEEIVRIALAKNQYLSDYYDFKSCIIIGENQWIGDRSVYNLISQNNFSYTEAKHYLYTKPASLIHGGIFKFYWTSGEHNPVPQFYILMNKKSIIPVNILSESKTPFLAIPNLYKYDYAIYSHGKMEESQGRLYPDTLNISAVMNGKSEHIITTNTRSELIKQINPNTTIIIGKDLLGLIKPVSLFSFLFVVIMLLALILSLINSVHRILPNQLPIYFTRTFNLRQRIEFSIILVIVFSFIAIAWVTSLYFKDLSNKMEQQQVNDKSIALVSEIEHRLRSTSLDSMRISALMEISTSHQLEFTIYTLEGTKVFSTIANQSISNLQEKMPAIPFTQMALGGEPYYFDIHSTNTNINKAYLPLRNDELRKIAWLQIPVKSSMDKTIFAPADFLGTLLNVYVFLLLMAGAIAIGIANSITKPIVRLVENLRKIKLGKKNETLVWNKSDEIGTLIKEYNNMLSQLESSADNLAKNEREGAWREMARQVAHEIKNPLTPMKLSAQYLMRKVEGKVDPEVEESIRNTTLTLIEQIDNLADIAGEFGNFARMPAPVMEYINLNSLISNIHDLFRKHDEAIFNYFEPIDDIYVMADRAHLMRVMNNLLKNAVQSIPHGRKGKIDVHLLIVDKKAVIKVKDNGIGIKEELRENVFSPNFTTKTSGMGLGLALSKSIIESFNGEIYFKTVTGEGTEFIIELPM